MFLLSFLLLRSNGIVLQFGAYKDFDNLTGFFFDDEDVKNTNFYVLLLDIVHQFRTSCSPFMRLLILFQDLEEFCFQFITSHLTAVSQTKSFKELDGETVKTLVIKAGKAGAFKK